MFPKFTSALPPRRGRPGRGLRSGRGAPRRPRRPCPRPSRRRFRPSGSARQNKGAAPERRLPRYENKFVSFSKISRVEEVGSRRRRRRRGAGRGDRDRPRACRPTSRSSASCPACGCPSRTRSSRSFQKSKGGDWNLLLVGHLPLRCSQSDDPAKCDELYAFRTVLFRFDDRPQVALEIVHAGEPHLLETHVYRLDRGRLETTFTATGPRIGRRRRDRARRHHAADRGGHVHQQGAAAPLPQLHARDQLRLRRAEIPHPLRESRAGVQRAGGSRALVLGPRPPVHVRLGRRTPAGAAEEGRRPGRSTRSRS